MGVASRATALIGLAHPYSGEDMSNVKKLAGLLAFVALVAVASPPAYRLLAGTQAAPAANQGTRLGDRRPGSEQRLESAAAGSTARQAPAQRAAQAQAGATARSGKKPRLGVMPRNALPGGGFAYIEGFNAGTGVDVPAAPVESRDENSMGTFIVLFTEQPLASYQGESAGLSMPSRQLGSKGRSRVDAQSHEAKNYVAYLQGRQQLMEEQMATLAGRSLDVRQRMQHAVNGIIVELTASEAKAVAKMPGVRLVEGYREYPTTTDVGPTLIGAPAAWAGNTTDPFGAAPVRGEGIVVGMIDSGINFGSPSFAATDPVDGYVHVNPFGSGVFVGSCAAGGDDVGRCNNKLIGGYDFVCGAPGNQCGVANVREEPGFGDTNGHGSHTASTAAGNRRDVTFNSAQLRISGVAPRANLIAYDACYTNTATGQGLCPNVSTLASINQAVADGVDVINYSIGGGTEPWGEAGSAAFLAATDAGVYVAASAGNSGPGPNTMGHLQPWVASTAAAQHGRGGFAFLMQVTGPGPVPPRLQAIVLNAGTGGVSLGASIPGTTPLRVSAGFDTTSDACAAFPANTFAGAIAVVRRGICSFSIKANNASAAGAIAVVLANNTAGVILPSVPGTTVPVFGVTQADGIALRDFFNANPTTATAQVGFPAVGLPNTADALASFSSRGPAGRFNLVKPDLTGPGVDVLAVLAGTTISGSEALVGTLSGTSMSSPHNAGSAALVKQARPSWTPAEVKSALMMTATTTVFLEDQVTLANPFARGSGRLRVDRAIKAGLVLNENAANFTAANPDAGGNTTTLNLASMANGRCVPTCQFTRTFRNPGTSGGLWSLRVTGLNASLSSSLVWVPVGASRTVTVTVDASALPANGSWNFGTLELTQRLSGGQSSASSVLTLPVAVAVPPPILSVPASVPATVAAGASGSAAFSVGNIGGAPLVYTVATTGSGVASIYEALRGAVNSGFRNTVYSDPLTAGSAAQFSADDFDVTIPTQISSLSAEGFVVSGAAFPGAATALTWSIYPDAAGVPAGNPQSAAASAVWTFTSTPTGPGVSTAGGFITLNLVTAGQNVVLPAGKYWLVVNTSGTFANRWAQFGSATGNGTFASISVTTAGVGTWASNNTFAGLNMQVRGLIPCGAPWLGAVSPAGGTLAGGASQATSAAINAAALAAGSYTGYLCVNSNDSARPSVALPLQLTVSPPPP